MEDNGLYDGFRKGRSYSQHILSVTSIIRNRKLQGKPTYTAFMDVEKAFDMVDKDLLLYKWLNIGIKGHIYEYIKSIYKKQLVLLM